MIVAIFGELGDAVGHRMPNRTKDVKQVQVWLHTWDKHFRPGSPGLSEGDLDGFTGMAIERFQREMMKHLMPSGIVAPEDATAKKLASTPGPKPEGRVLSLPIRTNFDPLSEEDYQQAAKELQCEVRAIEAVAQTETKKRAFDDRQRPSILFEPKHFHKWSKHRFVKSNPNLQLVNKRYGSYALQWRRFEEAYTLDSKAAIMGTSWDRFQTMGFNFNEAGFSLPEVFLVAMCSSEKDQLNAFVAFIKYRKSRLQALQNKNWADFAKYYNGPDYSENNYDKNMRDNYDKLAH